MPAHSTKFGHPLLLDVALALIFLCLASPLHANTGKDLSDRILIDGNSGDFTADEEIFGDTLVDLAGNGVLQPIKQERDNDSRWGFNNDINQIKVTWDSENIYVAVDGISWDNNIILLFDYLEGGIDKMTELNSWRRNFVFSNGFRPDLFLATWDGNTAPQLWRSTERANTVEQIDEKNFETVATFAQGNTGRSMEARIPWTVFYGEDLTRAWNDHVGDSTYVLPRGLGEGRPIALAAVLTAGGDGTGGPDSAPDNLGGHTEQSSDLAVIDNFAILPLDVDYYIRSDGVRTVLWDNTVTDTVVADSLPDLDGLAIQERRTFLFNPPIIPKNFVFGSIELNRPVVSPEDGQELRFTFSFEPEPDPESDAFRGIFTTAEIWSLNGERIKTLYRDDLRPVVAPGNEAKDNWDCRDEGGSVVDGGIYLLRFVVEPGVSATHKAFSVIR